VQGIARILLRGIKWSLGDGNPQVGSRDQALMGAKPPKARDNS